MFLTRPQRYIMDVLKKLKYVRQDQLYILVRERFRTKEGDVLISMKGLDAMLRQLRTGIEDIRMDDKAVWLKNALPNQTVSEAVDVMLELTEGTPQDFEVDTGSQPMLHFTWGGDKLRAFSVGKLRAADLLLRTFGDLPKSQRCIWLCGENAVPTDIGLPKRHYLAVRQADGTHRFYGSSES